jgi:murein L,D-transpeptidase YcbB/YkuD
MNIQLKIWKYGIPTAMIFTVLVADILPALSNPKPKYSSCKNNPQEYCLRRGDRGKLVNSLVGSLLCLGSDDTLTHYKDNPEKAVFTKQVENAVKRVQKDANIKIDGIAGPETRRAITYAC